MVKNPLRRKYGSYGSMVKNPLRRKYGSYGSMVENPIRTPKPIWPLWFYGRKPHKNPQANMAPYGSMVENRKSTIGNPVGTMIIDANIFVL